MGFLTAGMIGEISAGFGAAKGAMELLKSLNATSTQAHINDVKIGLQEKVLEMQSALTAANMAQAAASEKVRELEQEIMKLKDWEGEKQRYELKAIDVGAFAYMPKAGMENGEPAHWLCANCFGNGQKSYLQYRTQVHGNGRAGVHAIWGCHACRADVSVYFQRNPSQPWTLTTGSAE